MPKNLLLPTLLLLATPALAQRTELIAHADLGLFQFAGRDAVGSSFINYHQFNGQTQGYTNSPYGSHWGAGYGLGARLQRATRQQWVGALDVSYEWLRSRTNVDRLHYQQPTAVASYAADGTTDLRTQNLNFFLGLGRRFTLAAVRLDALVGPEVAVVLASRERGSGTYHNGETWTTDLDRSRSLPPDTRLRADLTAWYQRVGLHAGYSYGFLNYQSGLVGGSSEVYARVLRLGLAYRLR